MGQDRHYGDRLDTDRDTDTPLGDGRDDDEKVAGGGMGVVGGAAVGAAVGGPIGAVAGAVIGGVGGAAAGGAAEEVADASDGNRGGGMRDDTLGDERPTSDFGSDRGTDERTTSR